MASLFKRSNGVYYVVVIDDRGKRRWISTGTRILAEAEVCAQALTVEFERKGSIRLRYLSDEVLTYVRQRLSVGTFSIYERTLRRLIASVGDRPVRAFGQHDAERYILDRSRHVSPVTVNLELRTLRATFQRGLEWGLVTKNPFALVKLMRVPPVDPAFLTRVQFQSLLAVETVALYRDVFTLAVFTMLRAGELAQLRWEDVDMQRRVIRVRNHDGFRVKGLRNRTVPMNSDVFQLLQRRKHLAESPLVFSTQGRSLNTRTISHRFKKQCRKIGLDPRVHFHSLRHTGASWLAQAGVSLLTIQKILGHSSPTVTQIYSHLTESHLHEAIGLLTTSDQAGPSQQTGSTPVFSSN